MVRRLLSVALLCLSVWAVGTRAHAWFQADEDILERSAASCAVTSSAGRDAGDERWDVAPHAASLGASVWRAQPPDADTPAAPFAVSPRATTVVVAGRSLSRHVPPHLHDIPLLI